MKVFALLLINFFFTNPSFGKVNLANGQFHHREVDIKIPEKESLFKLWRAYNSQSKTVGLFGTGWCSNLEYSIKANTNNGFDLFLCENKRTSFQSNLKRQKIFYQKQEKLVVKDDTFIFSPRSGPTLHFNKKGTLIAFAADQGSPQKKVRLLYEKSTIDLVHRGLRLRLKLYDNKIYQGHFGSKKVLTYKYNNNNLKNLKNSWGQFIQYDYSQSNKLTKITDPEGHFVKIFYDKHNVVKKLLQNEKCTEKYNYLKKSKLVLVIEVNRSCKDGFSHKNQFLVNYDQKFNIKSIEDLYNKKNIKLSNKDQLRIFEKNKTGEYKYKYNQKGAVTDIKIKQKSARYQAKLAYNSQNKISRVDYIYPDKLNQSVRLQYTRSGKLSRLLASDNNNFHIFYSGGQLKKIKTKNAQLIYKHNSDKKLTQVNLIKGKNKYIHNLNNPQRSSKDNREISKYLNSLYSKLGPLHKDSDLLRGFF